MKSEVLYMAGVIAAGFVVNFGLRALPFLLFGGRDRNVPRWIDRAAGFVSPVIIAALVVYSFSGLAWKTPWPYLAGGVTVALQVWKRNALASIIVGTVIYMILLNCCGCATRRTLELDAQHPAVSVTAQGVRFGDEFVKPQEVAGILEDYNVPHDRVIHIQLDPDVRNLMPARTLMGFLSRAGYTRPVLVTRQHAESENLGKPKKPSAPTAKPAARPAPRRVIRYKGANE